MKPDRYLQKWLSYLSLFAKPVCSPHYYFFELLPPPPKYFMRLKLACSPVTFLSFSACVILGRLDVLLPGLLDELLLLLLSDLRRYRSGGGGGRGGWLGLHTIYK